MDAHGTCDFSYSPLLNDISIHFSDYRYRFHAPNHDNYEVSGVNFTTEKLENFNWNYMDQYICTRGDLVDFQLTESMKYWRYRMYLLPKDDPAMKKIIDNNLQRCKAKWFGCK
jgi:DEP domain-containing protein 5